MSSINRAEVQNFLLSLQDQYCGDLELVDDKAKFITDKWQKDTIKGGGVTRVLEDGLVFEQAGVNFSHVLGDCMPKAATVSRPDLEGASFEAMGVSIVIHPRNPMVPTSHANLRLFIATDKNTGKETWWFGGGFDLTPYFPFKEDCILWHKAAKEACVFFGEDVYSNFKKLCDDYFYLEHRQENRGIGGLFFDDLNESTFGSFDECFDFIKKVGVAYTTSYMEIINKRKNQIPLQTTKFLYLLL